MRRCEEDQDNEAMFFDAMYGKEDPGIFEILKSPASSTNGYVYLEEDMDLIQSEALNYIFEQRLNSESPNLITQLSVRLQFRLIKYYPLEPPLLGCKSVIGASRDQCKELLKYLKQCAKDRVGQVMLFDLVLEASEWLSARVRESNQGSLHEDMLETQRQRKAADDKQTELERVVSEQEEKINTRVKDLTPQRESELRRQWLLQSNNSQRQQQSDLSRREPLVSFGANISYTMSRFVKTQQSFLPKQGGGSLLQLVHILQQNFSRQQTLVSHLVAHWLSLSKVVRGEDISGPILDYLHSESLLDEKQMEMIKFPGRIPLNALFPNADSCSVQVSLLASLPSNHLQQRPAPSSVSGGEESPITTRSRYEEDFEEVGYCGSGSFGDVMKVRNRLDGIFYAVKKVRIGRVRSGASISNNKSINRLLREVTTLGRIQSPYVLRYHQAWIEEEMMSVSNSGQKFRLRVDNHNSSLRSSSFYDKDDRDDVSEQDGQEGGEKELSLYIQTAFCPRTLSDYLKNDVKSASVGELWRLTRMMLEGLAHIHSYGILHRDLKPGNIFIDSNGDIRIGDFGLATFEKNSSGPATEQQAIDSGGGGSIEHSRNIGTKLYAAPEQEQDERSDIYSLGIILFELWHPFRTPAERIDQILKLKQGAFSHSKFADSHPRQWKLISLMLRKSVSATAILQSDDLLPPRMEDDFLHDALKIVGNPNTPVFPRILERLFAQAKPCKQPPSPNNLLAEQRRTEFVSNLFSSVFERHGAVRVSAPLFALGGLPVLDQSGGLLNLRHELSFPDDALSSAGLLKRFDIAPVFLRSSAPTGSKLQPVQILRADFDLIGVDPVAAEAECLCLASEILEIFKSHIQWVRIRINHSALFQFVLDRAEISPACLGLVKKALADSADSASSCSRMDRSDLIRTALTGIATEKQINVISRWFRTSTGDLKYTAAAVGESGGNEEVDFAVKKIFHVMQMLDTILGPDLREKEFMLDLCSPPPPTSSEGFLYFRIDVAFNNNPDVGEAVAIGGRRSENLAGISWDLSKFIQNVAGGVASCTEVLVCAVSESSSCLETELRSEQIAVARDLWRAKVSADVFYGAASASLQEQLEFALARGVKLVVIIRERDIQSTDPDYNLALRVIVGAKGKQLKEQTMKRSELISYITHSS